MVKRFKAWVKRLKLHYFGPAPQSLMYYNRRVMVVLPHLKPFKGRVRRWTNSGRPYYFAIQPDEVREVRGEGRVSELHWVRSNHVRPLYPSSALY